MCLSLLIQIESVVANKINRNSLNNSIQKIKGNVIFNRYLIKSLQYRLDFLSFREISHEKNENFSSFFIFKFI